MSENIEWTWVYTGSDFLAGILRNNLEVESIRVMLRSNTTSAMAAGYGFTGMTQVFVDTAQMALASPLVKEFDELQKRAVD